MKNPNPEIAPFRFDRYDVVVWQEGNVRWWWRRRCPGCSTRHGDAVAAESGDVIDDLRRDISGAGEGGEGAESAAVEPAGDEGVHSDKGGAGEGLHRVEEEQDALGGGELQDEGERV